MNFKAFLLSCLFLLVGTLTVIASHIYKPRVVNPLDESSRWTKLNGLEGHAIRYMAEGSNQTVWISSNHGVLSYDGYGWTNHKGYGLLTDKVANHLHINGDIIYATNDDGIFQFKEGKWTSLFLLPASVDFKLSRVLKRSDRQALMACTNWGLFVFEESQIKIITSPGKASKLKLVFPTAKVMELPSLTGGSDAIDWAISDIIETEESLWLAHTIAERKGEVIEIDKASIDDGELQIKNRWGNNTVNFGGVQKLLLAEDGKIWVINFTSNKGVHVFDGEKWEVISLTNMLGGDEVMLDIIQTKDGTIWISGLAAVNSYKNGKWSRYTAPNYPIPANRIILQKSSCNELWIAGYNSSLVILDLDLENHINYDGLSYQCQDDKGVEWFITEENEVVTHDHGIWTAYDQSDGLMDAPISILHTSKDQIWVTGSEKRISTIALFENSRWTKHMHPELSWSIDYRSAFESRDGRLWFGGAVDGKVEEGFFSGVLELKNPTEPELQWKHHKAHENGFSKSDVYGIAESPDGRIWVGGSKLLSYDGSSWQESSESLLVQRVNDITNTEDLLVVGSRYSGVFLFDGTNWTNYTTEDGLSSNTIISIEAISNDNIIAATENGICRYDGVSWSKNVFPENYNLDFEGGTIKGGNGNSVWINHVPRSWNRRVYHNNNKIKTDWDFHAFFDEADTNPPETIIDFYQKEVSTRGKVIITWKGHDYFSNTPVNNLSYSYQLDNEPWSPFTASTQFSFENLLGGKHSLKVKARDRDFNVDQTPAMVKFRALPPVWQRLWFLLLLISFGSLYAFIEYRLADERSKLKMLNANLLKANDRLEVNRRKNELQNKKILKQQDHILKQSEKLRTSNLGLESRNEEIKEQRDQLELLVEEIESLSKAKVSFFTNISHELRTPLTLIVGPIEQLMSNSDNLDPHNKSRLYSIINRNATRLLRLIDQLLEIRSIEDSALEVNNTSLDVVHHVKGIVELFDNLALRRGIGLRVNTKIDSGQISVDADKLEKIVVNLLSNAFKHTQDGGNILISISDSDQLSNKIDEAKGPYFHIVVEDDGLGISDDHMEHIFKEFYTSNQKNTTTKNSGIGLKYVKDLVELMDGRIEVTSGSGTTRFVISLPYFPHYSQRENIMPKLAFAKKESDILMDSFSNSIDNRIEIVDSQQSILIVDDDEEMLCFLEGVLKRDYNVLKAVNGVEGLKVANSFEVDLIISDVMMPEMDGFDFLTRLRGDLTTSHIPIIVLTAKAFDESILKVSDLGADDYLTKPFRLELLLSRVSFLLRQRKNLREIYLKDYVLRPKKEIALSQEEALLYKLSEAMERNYGDSNFNVDSMCKLAHMSHMHFIRKIKQLTGKKPIDLLKSFRMDKAKELLSEGNCSIGEVGYRVGFEIPNSFSRAFKKEFDMTPSQYVSNYKESKKTEA